MGKIGFFDISAAGCDLGGLSDKMPYAQSFHPYAQSFHIDVSKTVFLFSSRAFAFVCGQPDGRLLEAVASALELEQMASVEETIHDGRGSGVVAQQFPPILEWSV